MAAFSTKRTLFCSTSLLPDMAGTLQEEFERDGYEVKVTELSTGGYDISITKGGVFKAVLGMKTALKITLTPLSDKSVAFEAGVGIFGQQAIPTIISMFFFWPVLITQVWGLIQQSNLDDKAAEIVEKVIANSI